MMPYMLSLGAGILVGVLYALLGVRSPAPPTIALIGLLGMLVGEQAVPVVKRLIAGQPVLAFIQNDCARHILGPQAGSTAAPDAATPPAPAADAPPRGRA
ncbi:XapX domain-containing protein (plasmid) [Azospirillum sp. TSH58]|uniref:XapX domain-containing protein n=2 Tax=Azospirillum sp. TSH58 TaxID=664962 RepID=UPI000D601E63|nr:XapX domain-containing protein [Azospirillum sp. TSH58]AWJ87069.1 XapX domain-containing protein [Azospirillum sp. TSH58]PWC66920.1 XapX domain-containing protein [Azospirillum sp. TSH58]